jgi:hypothetical protein
VPALGRWSLRTFPSCGRRSNWILLEQVGDQIGDPVKGLADGMMFHVPL